MRIHELLTLNEDGRVKFTPEKKQRALELWDQGKSDLSDKEIAKLVGIGRDAVRMFLNKEWKKLNPDIPRPTAGYVTPEKKTQILNLWKKGTSGLSDKEIAKQVGVSKTTVSRFLNATWEESYPNTTRPTKLRVPLTPEKKTQILNLWKKGTSGLSDQKIADEVGVSKRTVSNFLNITWKESNPNILRPTLHTPISELEIKTMKNLYMEGYGPTYIASQLTKLYGVLRHHNSVLDAIRRQTDYTTLLRPRHLENLKILVGTSHMEIAFFNNLQKELEQAFPNNIIKLERTPTPKVFRDGGKLFYLLDGLINEKLVVEFNGTLWHADPLEIYKRGDRRGQQQYPDDKFMSSLGVTAGEKRQYDNERTKWLANYYGIEPVIIWQREYKSNPKECIDRVIDRVRKIVN